MRLTRSAEYAVRCVHYLTGQEQGVVVNRKEIARVMEIPEQFLGKIAKQLARAGVLEIVQGPKGGIRLIASPEKLSLLDVVEVMTGEIFLNDCIMNPDSCSRNSTCSIHRLWQKAREQLRHTLNEATFADLLREETCLSPSVPSDIKEKEAS